MLVPILDYSLYILYYGTEGFRKIIVKPDGKVITIERSADASSVEEVVRFLHSFHVRLRVEGG